MHERKEERYGTNPGLHNLRSWLAGSHYWKHMDVDKSGAIACCGKDLPERCAHFFLCAGGYVCRVYWQGLSWLVGVLPAFIIFLLLFIVTIRGVFAGSKAAS
jgi:hypothetical protein